mgnify:CR=1 FL=1
MGNTQNWTGKDRNFCHYCGHYVTFRITTDPWKKLFHKECFNKMIKDMMKLHNMPYSDFGKCFCGALFLKCKCGRSASTCVGCSYNKSTSHYCKDCE